MYKFVMHIFILVFNQPGEVNGRERELIILNEMSIYIYVRM